MEVTDLNLLRKLVACMVSLSTLMIDEQAYEGDAENEDLDKAKSNICVVNSATTAVQKDSQNNFIVFMFMERSCTEDWK
jgi:hypothetical protein